MEKKKIEPLSNEVNSPLFLFCSRLADLGPRKRAELGCFSDELRPEAEHVASPAERERGADVPPPPPTRTIGSAVSDLTLAPMAA